MAATGDEPGVVVIVGAGVGGLAAAVGLTKIGRTAVVLEQAPELRAAGAGISLLANAQRSLDELGVGSVIRAGSASMMPGGEGVRTPSGRRLMKQTSPDFVHRHGLSTIVLPRRDLHRALSDVLPEGCVRTGAEVTGIAGGVVTYRDRTGEHTIEADLVVAADGLNSRARQAMFPGVADPVYSGHSVFRGIAETTAVDPGGTTWGRGLEFGRMPLAGDRAYWYAVVNARPGMTHADPHAEVLRRFGGWHDPIPALVRATPPDSVLYNDVFELAERLPSYRHENTVLLGDAAHAMTSDLGQGACQALEDAVVLSAALAGFADLTTALSTYDEQRRPRTQMIAEASRRIGRMKLREKRWEVLVRNVIMAVTPPRAGETAMARIGDWQPPGLPGRVSA
jgi:2-polyprenyl-6-methoxyphenol hydroxylase-like FAD-dependent oxidoreductase